MNTQTQHLERKYRNDRVLISNLRKKLIDNNIILLKADKGNTAILLHKHVYAVSYTHLDVYKRQL